MAIKDILLHLGPGERSSERTDVACLLAQAHEAHLTAIYFIAPPYIPSYPGIYAGSDIIQPQIDQARAEADEMKAAVEEAAQKYGLASEWRVEERSDWRVPAHQFHCADLVVLGQRGRGGGDEREVIDMPEEVALVSGRPILIVPYVGTFEAVGRRVMLAWNGTREAARAAHDALPILERADQVVVYTVNPPGAEPIPGAAIATHLARHGARVEAQSTIVRDIEVGDALLNSAHEFGIDLVVMGAYGHSRFREFMLGGVTRHLLHHMTCPILMSH